MAGEEGVEARPCEPLGARSSLQPFAPQLDDLLAMPAHLPNVPRAAVVCHVTDEFGREAIVLPAQRLGAVGATPLVDRCQRTGQTVLRRRLPPPVLGAGCPLSGLCAWMQTGPLRSSGDPSCALAPFQDPGRADVSSPYRPPRCGPRWVDGEGLGNG